MEEGRRHSMKSHSSNEPSNCSEFLMCSLTNVSARTEPFVVSLKLKIY